MLLPLLLLHGDRLARLQPCTIIVRVLARPWNAYVCCHNAKWHACAGPSAESLRILFGGDKHAAFQGFKADDLNSALALLEHLTAVDA